MKQYIAMAVGVAQNSSFRENREDAIAWAKKTLANNPNITQVLICESTAIVERASVPITVRDIPTVAAEDTVMVAKAA